MSLDDRIEVLTCMCDIPCARALQIIQRDYREDETVDLVITDHDLARALTVNGQGLVNILWEMGFVPTVSHKDDGDPPAFEGR